MNSFNEAGPNKNLSLKGWPKVVVWVAGSVAIALGVTVITGWHAHLPALVQIRPTFAPMQYNTALCILLLGGALCLHAFGRTRRAQALGVFVAVGSGLTLFEYWLKTNLGIDQLFFKSYIATETSNVGRMSPITALCLFQMGLAWVVIGFRRKKKWHSLAVGLLASIVISLCSIAILGYIFGLPRTYGWGQLTRMALHTAGGLGVLGVGIFVIAWIEGCEKDGNTPRWLPVPVALGTSVAAFILWLALAAKQDLEIAQNTQANAETVQNQINIQMESRVRGLMRMSERWNFSGRPARPAWEDDAENYLHDFPDLQAIEWIDAAHLVRWIVPLKGNETKIGVNLLREERRGRAAEMAEAQRQPVLTQAVELFHGGNGFVVYTPLHVGKNSDGVIGGVFNAQVMFDTFLPGRIAAGNSIAIFESGRKIYQRNPSPLPAAKDWIVDSTIQLNGAVWNVRVWPTPELTAQLDTSLPEIVLAVGLAISCLLSLAVRLTQVARARVEKIAEIEERLRLVVEGVKDYAILMLDPEGRVTTWSSGAEHIKGYTAAEIIGQHFSKFHPPEALAAGKPQQELADALAKGQIEDKGWRVRKDGTRFFADLTITAIYDPQGRHRGFGKVTRDITGSWRVQEALRASEQRVRLATEAAGVAVWDWDIKTDAIQWDEQMFKIYGFSPKPEGLVAYQDWSVRVLPEDLVEQEKQLQHTVATGGHGQREYRITRASDNAVRFIQSAEIAVAGEDGRTARVVGVNLDITERKNAEAKLAEQAAELKRSNQELHEALENIKTLSGLLPICAGCRKVRDDEGYWSQIETYVAKHSGASFSHGLCPECSIKFFQEGGLPVPDEVREAAKKMK